MPSPAEAWLSGQALSEAPETAPASPAQVWLAQPVAGKAAKPKVEGSYIDNLMRQIAQGATFGWADEIAARMNALTGGMPYAEGVKAERGRTAAFAEQNPLAAFSAELGGGLTTGLPGAAKVMAMRNIPTLARLGIVGGTAGGLAGGGYSEAPDFGGTAKDIAVGAGTGAVLAPALGIAGNALLRGGQANLLKAAGVGAAAGGTAGALTTDFDPYATTAMAVGGAALPFAGNRLIEAARNIGGNIISKYGQGSASYGVRKINEALQRGEITPDDARAALNAMGPEAALADLPAESLQLLGEAVTTRPGKPADVARKFLTERSKRELPAVRQATQQATGSTANYFRTMEQLEKEASEKAAPLYKEAYAANKQVESKAINRILETDAGREALRSAARRMSNRMSLMGVPDKELTELKNDAVLLGKMAETGTIAKGLKLETLDLVKRELDDMWLTAKKAAERGTGRASDARDLNELRRGFVNALDEADVTAKAGPNSLKPEGGAYKRGRAAYAGPTHAQDVMEEGLALLKKAPEEIQSYMAGLSQADKAFAMHGVTRALDDLFMSTPRGSSPSRKLLRDQGMTEEKLRAALGTQADDYIKQLETRIRFKESETKYLRGSPTKRRESAERDLGIDPAPLVEAATGHPISALMRLGGNLLSDLPRPSERQLSELGPMLFNPAMREQVLNMVGQRAGYNQLISRYLGLPTQAGMALSAGQVPAYLSSGQRP